MTASPVVAAVAVDRFTTAHSVSVFAHLEHQLDGSQPYVRIVDAAVRCDPFELLPDGATVERCVTTDNSVVLFARVDGASIHLDCKPSTTAIWIAATTRSRSEDPSVDACTCTVHDNYCVKLSSRYGLPV